MGAGNLVMVLLGEGMSFHVSFLQLLIFPLLPPCFNSVRMEWP